VQFWVTMTLSPFFRKFALTAHITFSVGWLGAVAGFLALAVAGLASHNPQLVRSSYLTMELMGWFVIVPACLGALLTGITQSLGTNWGLFRYYWVLVKLLLTLAATILLLVHMQPISYLAAVAAKATLAPSELRGLRIQLIADAVAAIVVLLGAITLSVYKPWGTIRYESWQQKTFKAVSGHELTTGRPWGQYVLLGLGCLILLFVILHLTGGGLHGH
jgi:hypothetical protein